MRQRLDIDGGRLEMPPTYPKCATSPALPLPVCIFLACAAQGATTLFMFQWMFDSQGIAALTDSGLVIRMEIMQLYQLPYHIYFSQGSGFQSTEIAECSAKWRKGNGEITS